MNAYALPPRCAVVGLNARDAHDYMATDLDHTETFGMDLVVVATEGHFGQVAGMVLSKFVETPRAASGRNYAAIKEELDSAVLKGERYYKTTGDE